MSVSQSLKYKSRQNQIGYWCGVLLFPLWGVVMPALFIINLCSAMVLLVSSPATSLIPFGAGFYCAAAFLLGAIFTGVMKDNEILIDNSGIAIPFLLSLKHKRRRYLPWADVEAVLVETDGQASAAGQKQKVVIKSADGEIDLALANFKNMDREQLLISLSLFAPETAVDNSLLSARDALGQEKEDGEAGANLHLPSFTSIWEEELVSRFSSTAYVPLYPGQSINDGRYTVIRQLNLGGWSAVYLCQEAGNKLVVAKESVIPVTAGAREELKEKAVSMFTREAQLLLRIQHPNIVKVFDHFVDNERQYIILENLTGENLRKHVQLLGRRHELDVIDYAFTLARILQYLHGLEPPLVHRDLTPDNIILDNEEKLHLIDFGAANELIGTATGTMVGKQCYMAPEQFKGKATTRSDLYSLGATLAFLLTGKDPLPMNPVDINSENSDFQIRPSLNQLVLTLTDLDESKRGTAAQVIQTLQSISRE